MRSSLDISLSSSSSYTAWDPALVVLDRYVTEATALVSEFPLDEWESAFAAAEHRTVVKAALRPGHARP